MCDWGTYLYIKHNSADGVITDQLLRDSAYDLEHGTMPMFDNRDHISGKSNVMGHGNAPIVTDEANDSSDYDEVSGDIPEDAPRHAENAMPSTISILNLFFDLYQISRSH
jgi:hypothetical protein